MRLRAENDKSNVAYGIQCRAAGLQRRCAISKNPME